MNNKGFGILGMVIILGIMAVITAASLKIYKITNKKSKRVTQDFLIKTLLYDIKLELGNLNACKYTFNKDIEVGQTFDSIKKRNDDVLYSVGIIRDSISLKEVKIISLTHIKDSLYNADIQITFERNNDFLGAKTFSDNFTILFELDGKTNKKCLNQLTGDSSSIDGAPVVDKDPYTNDPPVMTSDSNRSIAENSSSLKIEASDPENDTITFSIKSGEDKDKFQFNGDTLEFKTAPDFENPIDNDKDNVYKVVITLDDGTNQVDYSLEITVTDVAEGGAPVFESNTSFVIDENKDFSTVISYSDPDGDDVTVTLLNYDSSLFTLTGDTLSTNAKDFENPIDEDKDNVYKLEIQLDDGSNKTTVLIDLTIKNVNTAPIINNGDFEATYGSTDLFNIDITDPDNDTWTYSISGEDASLINISGNTLSFKDAVQEGNCTDSDKDCVYNITLKVSDQYVETTKDVKITFPSSSTNTVKKIVAGNGSTCYIYDSNRVKCWGYGGYGVLGQDDTSNIADGSQSIISTSYLEFNIGQEVKSVYLGGNFACAILSDDTVRCWGDNTYGQLGYNNTNPVSKSSSNKLKDQVALDFGTDNKVKSLALGWEFACAILSDDTVRCWGDNTYGQLGYNDTVGRADGSGPNLNTLNALQFNTGTKVKAISAGGGEACAILTDNTLRCWGANNKGQLGYNDTVNRADGSGPNLNTLNALQFNTGTKVKSIVVGLDFSCSILDDDTARCWGSNREGQLGDDTTNNIGDSTAHSLDLAPEINFPDDNKIKEITLGGFNAQERFACAIKQSGRSLCWGYNKTGDLGYSDGADRSGNSGISIQSINYHVFDNTNIVKSISAGHDHTCAILDNDALKCWGNNAVGQLGYNDTQNRSDGSAGNDLDEIDDVPL